MAALSIQYTTLVSTDILSFTLLFKYSLARNIKHKANITENTGNLQYYGR